MVGGEYQTCEQVTSLRWCFVIFLLLAVGEGNIWTHFSFWMGRLRKQVKKCMRGCFPKLMQLKAAVWFACLNSWTIDRATSILILVLAKVVAKRKEARQPNWPERAGLGTWDVGDVKDAVAWTMGKEWWIATRICWKPSWGKGDMILGPKIPPRGGQSHDREDILHFVCRWFSYLRWWSSICHCQKLTLVISSDAPWIPAVSHQIPWNSHEITMKCEPRGQFSGSQPARLRHGGRREHWRCEHWQRLNGEPGNCCYDWINWTWWNSQSCPKIFNFIDGKDGIWWLINCWILGYPLLDPNEKWFVMKWTALDLYWECVGLLSGRWIYGTFLARLYPCVPNNDNKHR